MIGADLLWGGTSLSHDVSEHAADCGTVQRAGNYYGLRRNYQALGRLYRWAIE